MLIMKKIIIVVVAIVGFVGLVVLMRYHPASTPATASRSKSSPTSSSSDSSSSTSTTATPPPAPPSTPTATGFKDGSYTGQAVNVGYGIVQVKAVVSGGKLSDVVFLQMPSGGHSSEVTNFAQPQLKSEALQAQSGNVDIVSGATQTAQGFIQSLQDALAKA